MILDTVRLFRELLRALGINVVCDVGSMDGADALACRAEVPRARIIAFEPNPANQRLMRADAALARGDIEVQPLAVSNYDGDAELFLVPADYTTNDWHRGMSSLHRRPSLPDPQTVVPVTTTRLDTFFAARRSPDVRVALWIDAEGTAYEVIDGAAGLSDRLYLVHVEVESVPCIAPDQRLYPDVRALLGARGFVELAIDQSRRAQQFNAVFVRRALPAGAWLRVLQCAARMRLQVLTLKTKATLSRGFCHGPS